MKLDGDTQHTSRFFDPAPQRVDHVESAKENIYEVFSAVLPDKMFTETMVTAYSLGALTSEASQTTAWQTDLKELALAPFTIPKDLIDAAYHGIRAGLQALAT